MANNTSLAQTPVNLTLSNGFKSNASAIEMGEYYRVPNGFISSFCRVAFVFLLRAGYIFIQLGSVPTENVYMILLQNIVDISVSLAVFGLLGYVFAFGHDVMDGVMGFGLWICSANIDLDNAILGFASVLVGTAIITTIVSGRLHFVGYLLTTVMYSGILQPIVMHWFWHQKGFFASKMIKGQLVAAKDHAGAAVVHVSAGTGSLIASLFLGRRLLKLYDVDESSIGTESPGTTIVGYILVLMGLMAFSLPTPSYELDHASTNHFGLIMLNNLLGISGSILMIVVLSFIFSRKSFHYWIIQRCMQGAIVGLVSISAGVDVYLPITAFGIAAGGGILFCAFSRCIYWSSIEDYCNIIPMHLICGVYSLIIVSVSADKQNVFTTKIPIILLNLFWQFMGACVVMAATTLSFTLIYVFLLVTGFLRNKNEKINHQRSVNVSKHCQAPWLQRLFTICKDTPCLEPGPSGKNPDDITFRKSQNFERTRDPSTHLFKNREKGVGKIEERIELIGTYVQEDKFNSNNPIETSFVGNHKKNTIFTMTNVEPFVSRCKISLEQNISLDCAGDFQNKPSTNEKSTKAPPTLPKPIVLSNKIKKVTSGYDLHRTKKHTNLCRKRRMQNWFNFETNFKKTEYLPNKIDTMFNDGFVSIKPPKNLSDVAD